jgi:hypothetical protein
MDEETFDIIDTRTVAYFGISGMNNLMPLLL